MPDLIIAHHDLEIPALASGTIYAVLHDPRDSEALNLSSGNLEAFDGDHELFGIVLYEDPIRTRYHVRRIDPADITLPDTAPGDEYELEFWEQVGALPDRTADRLIATDEFIWQSDLRTDARLSETQIYNDILTYAVPGASGTVLDMLAKAANIPDEPASVRWEAFCALSFKPDITRIGLCAWLEKDGELVIDAKRVTWTLYDSSGATCFTKSNLVATTIGFFFEQYLTFTPSPNDTYFLTATIRDINDVDHTSAASPVTWN